MSVTLEVFLPSFCQVLPAIFKAHIVELRALCSVAPVPATPHNGRLAPLFQKWLMRNFPKRAGVIVGLNQAEIQYLSLISLWENSQLTVIKGVKWKFKYPVGVAYLPVPVLWKEILTISTDKKLSQIK